jgi:hypothetical protein
VKSVKSVRSANRLPRLELLAVLGAEVALVVALHLAGGPAYGVPVASIPDWLQSADPAVALVALARLAALAIGYWLLATTVAYAAAHHLGWHSVTGSLRWVTLPFVRRVVHGVTAMSLTGATLLGPATMTTVPALAQSAVLVQDVGGDGASTTSVTGTSEVPDPAGYQPEAAGWPDTGRDGDFWRPTALTEGLPAAATSHTVVPQDNLWGIAEGHLRQTVGRDVTEDEVTQYWLRVVDANRATLRSGDPNLIYPQEQVTLPPVFSE